MKRALSMLLAGVTLMTVLSACGGNTDSPPTDSAAANTSSGETTYADTIVIGDNGEPKNLDPDQSWGASEARFSCFIYEGLVREDENGDIVPLLATDWTISDDGMTYTFNLKPDVKFSDGTPVTGEDWIWSLERARDNPESNSRTMASNIVSIEAPDDTTLVITLDSPVASFLANCCKWNMVVKSKAHYEEVGAEAEELTYLGAMYTSPGFSSEVLHMYLARDLSRAQSHPDDDEFLNVVTMPFEELFQKVMDGTLEDAKTVATVLKTKVLLNL